VAVGWLHDATKTTNDPDIFRFICNLNFRLVNLLLLRMQQRIFSQILSKASLNSCFAFYSLGQTKIYDSYNFFLKLLPIASFSDA